VAGIHLIPVNLQENEYCKKKITYSTPLLISCSNCIRNGYSKYDIGQALHPKQKPQTKDEKLVGVALLPYQQAITNKISRLLAKHNIRTIHIPKKKNIHMLRPVKDDLGLKVPGVYRIPCECGEVYVGQTGRSVEARCKEHMRHICLEQPESLPWRSIASTSVIALISAVPLCWTRQQDTWTAS
jgi:hypothetical protein